MELQMRHASTRQSIHGARDNTPRLCRADDGFFLLVFSRAVPVAVVATDKLAAIIAFRQAVATIIGPALPEKGVPCY